MTFCTVLLLLCACKEKTGNTGNQAVGNSAPTISGSPPESVKSGESYSFTPEVFDADGDPLSFSIANQPLWAEFDTNTGALSGRPLAGDEGTYEEIVIRVSDGASTSALDEFSIAVTQVGVALATLSWVPPSRNSDGSPLTDLARYKIYYGTKSGSYPNVVEIDNPGIATYVVDGLTPNTYYFAATAINKKGKESRLSKEAVLNID